MQINWGGGSTTGTYSGGGSVTQNDWWNRTPGGGGVAAPSYTPPSTTSPTQIDTIPSAPDVSPGSFGVDITSVPNAVQSVQSNIQSGTSLIDDLGSALFGKQGIVSRIPLIGEGIAQQGRMIGANPLSEAAYSIPGRAADVIGGALTSDFAATQDAWKVNKAFQDAPASPEKQAVEDAIAADPLHSIHLKHQFNVAQSQLKQETSPDLTGDLFIPGGTLIDTLGQTINGFMRIGQRYVERGIAGMGRLQEIQDIGAGKVMPQEHDPIARWISSLFGNKNDTPLVLDPRENLVATNLASGKWSQAQALDFLAREGAGLSHDALTEIVGQVVTDPMVWASLGSAGVAKVGAAGVAAIGREAATGVVEQTLKADILRFAGGAYGGLEGTTRGTIAKGIRVIIDPLHSIGGHNPTGGQMLDIYSDQLAKAGHATYGFFNAQRLYSHLSDVSPALYDKVSRAFKVYMTNVGRTILAEDEVEAALGGGIARRLEGINPATLLDETGVAARTPLKPIIRRIKEYAEGVREINWDDAAVHNLAKRMAAGFGEHDEEGWYNWLQKFAGTKEGIGNANPNNGILGMLHAASYGQANRDLLTASRDALAGLGKTAYEGLKLDRLVLLNRSTLTRIGAEGFLQDMSKLTLQDAADRGLKSIEDLRIAMTRDFINQYDLGYVSLNEGSLSRDVQRFETWLERRIADGDLPMQLTDAEVAKMPAQYQTLHEHYGSTFTLGFSPELDRKWGIVPDLEGNPSRVFKVWVDHVDDGMPGFRPGHLLRSNIAGMPIVGKPVRGVFDALDAGVQTLRNGISGKMISVNAGRRFESTMAAKYDLTPGQSKGIWRALQEVARLNETSVRGLKGKDIYSAVAHLLPTHLAYGPKAISQRDFLNIVFDAYQGDLRYVGLTQSLTGRIKTALVGSDNVIGQITEDMFPKWRFTRNPIFQTQRRIEGIVLNSARGNAPAFHAGLGAVDEGTANALDKIMRTSYRKMDDTDMREFGQAGMHASKAETDLMKLTGREKWTALNAYTNVEGAEWANYIHTIRAGMGKTLKQSMEEAGATGEWDRIAAVIRDTAGKALTDDEVAVQYLTERALDGSARANRIIYPGMKNSDFLDVIQRDVWHLPRSLGEIQPLGLDLMARSLKLRPIGGGPVLDTAAKIRQALVTGKMTVEHVKEVLGHFNAHKDYVEAVDRALTFNYASFFARLTKKYSLEAGEAAQIERMIYAAAERRGVTPVDYLSQIVSPIVGQGDTGLITDLGKAVSILRAPKVSANPHDLMRQLADLFNTYLDPSGRQILIDHYGAEKGGLDAFARDILERAGTDNPSTHPDVERIMQEFKAWSDDVIRKGLSGEKETLGTHAMSPDGYPRGRYTDQTEIAQLHQRGQALLDQASRSPARPITTLSDQATVDELFTRTVTNDTADAWGGVTLDPGSGKVIENIDPLLYHGTREQFAESIAKSGVNRGDWTVFDSPAIPRGPGHVLYRARQSDMVGGTAKAADWISNPRVAMSKLDVSLDDGKTWQALDQANPPGGPYLSAVGQQSDISIADAADPAKFKAALDEFVNANRDELAKDGHYVGIFNNHDTGLVEFDVSIAAKTRSDAEALQVAAPQYQTGGAFDVRAGPSGAGVFAPVVRPTSTPSRYGDLLERIAGIPTENAFPFNKTEQMIVSQFRKRLEQLENDAYKLHYFARERSFLERSLNHMFFGIYPASYMYGKILPEMARFVATSPFGLRTGGLAYALEDVQKSLAIQYEYDPKMQKMVDRLGKGGVVWFLGYLLPAVPWDVGAGAPGWARNLAKQVEDNKARAAKGKPEKPINLGNLLDTVAEYINPLRPATQLEGPIKEINDIINPKTTEPAKTQAPSTKTSNPTVPQITPAPTATAPASGGTSPLVGAPAPFGPGIPSGETLSQREKDNYQAYYAQQVAEYRTFATSLRSYLDEVNKGNADAGDLPDVVSEFQDNLGWSADKSAAFIKAVKRDGPNSALTQFFPYNYTYGWSPSPEERAFKEEFYPTWAGSVKWRPAGEVQVEDLRPGIRNPETYVLHSAQTAINRAQNIPKAAIRALYPVPGEIAHDIYMTYETAYNVLDDAFSALKEALF